MMFKWLDQVGSEINTFPGKNLFKKSNPILNPPVPLKHYTVATFPSFKSGLLSPKQSLAECSIKVSRPSTPRYSLFNFPD